MTQATENDRPEEGVSGQRPGEPAPCEHCGSVQCARADATRCRHTGLWRTTGGVWPENKVPLAELDRRREARAASGKEAVDRDDDENDANGGDEGEDKNVGAGKGGDTDTHIGHDDEADTHSFGRSRRADTPDTGPVSSPSQVGNNAGKTNTPAGTEPRPDSDKRTVDHPVVNTPGPNAPERVVRDPIVPEESPASRSGRVPSAEPIPGNSPGHIGAAPTPKPGSAPSDSDKPKSPPPAKR